jgi:RNA polymerase sigma factor (TIGR02999 family)
MNGSESTEITSDLTFEQLYAQLRRIAQQVMRSGERPSHTLPPTALVHDYLLSLPPKGNSLVPDDPKELSAIARLASFRMRRILIDYARHRRRHHPESIDRVGLSAVDGNERSVYFPDLEALHEAMEELYSVNPAAATIANLRFFAGLKYPEIANKLGISLSTAERRWQEAKAWLREHLR